MMSKIVFVFLVLLFVVVPVGMAQEATDEATQIPTEQPTDEPEVVVPPVIIEVNDQMNMTDVAMIAGIVFAVGVVLYRVITSGSDTKRAEEIRDLRDNRVLIESLEEQYARLSETNKLLISTIGTMFGALTKLIPGTADDELADLIKDIQNPGDDAEEKDGG